MVVGSLSPFGLASQDFRLPVAVFRITPSSVEEHRFDNFRSSIELMVAHGQPHTGELRWTGHDFVPDKLVEFPVGFPHGATAAFSNIDGWSKLSFLSPEEGSPALETEFSLHGHAERLITTTRDRLVSIDLDRRDGAAPQRLVSIDTRSRGVSPDEYDSLFRR